MIVLGQTSHEIVVWVNSIGISVNIVVPFKHTNIPQVSTLSNKCESCAHQTNICQQQDAFLWFPGDGCVNC